MYHCDMRALSHARHHTALISWLAANAAQTDMLAVWLTDG